MLHNPPIYTGAELEIMTMREVIVAHYQLNLISVLLLLSVAIYLLIFLTLRWVLPKFWYKNKRTDI